MRFFSVCAWRACPLLTVGTLLAAMPAAAQPCTLHIDPGFAGGPFLDGPIVMREFDADGLPQLVVAGGNLWRDTDGVNENVLRWNGAQWTSLGAALNGWVSDMVVWDADAGGPGAPALFVGGFFTVAAGNPALGIAKWDGNSWQPLAPGPPYMSVYGMTVHDADGLGPQLPALVVVGGFPAFVGAGSANIARWNGTAWSAVHTSAPSTNYLSAVTSYDADAGGGALPTLVVIANDQFNRVLRLVNSNWLTISTGNIFPTQLASFDPEGAALPELIVGGNFQYPGVAGGAGVVRWNGTSWSALDGGVTTDGAAPGTVSHLDVFDPDGDGPLPRSVFVSGSFSYAGNLPASNVARWDGTGWSAVCTPNAPAYAAASFDPDGPGPEPRQPVISGEFTGVDNVPAAHIAIAAPAGWQNFGSAGIGNGLSDIPTAFEYFDFDGQGPEQPQLFTGGFFNAAGAIGARGLALLDETTWTAPPFAVPFVNTLKVADLASSGSPSLYVAGSGLLRWNGITLETPGAALGGSVYALELFDPDGAGTRGIELIAGGSFPTIGTIPNSRYIASWDGTAWSALGAGVSLPVRALCVMDLDGDGPGSPLLAVGMQSAVSCWSGSAWTPIGASINGSGVQTMTTFDADGAGPLGAELYVGGFFSRISGVTPLNNIARWNGTQWSSLGSGASSTVQSLAVHDLDGDGPQPSVLLAGGRFQQVNGQPIPYLAAWNGTAWVEPPARPNAEVSIVRSILEPGSTRPRLLLGGGFNYVSGVASERFASISCTVCLGDINADGAVDLSDLSVLLSNFGRAGDATEEHGDFDADQDVDLADLTVLLSHFGQPC